ncbi:hypothetical protein L9F63_006422, partial [Diploptera punctata]
NQLSSVFTLIEEVNVLDSRDEAHLALLERPELGITFTKLHCWRLTQYEKCVFLDADTLVLKNSDELFEREELSAAPDPGWPDCFNSGVFVYRPSLDTFNALIKFALSKGSFDGGDQGLLNLFFSDWATKDISRHLPFIYNMVSTATYSYLPAYKQFLMNKHKMSHFIGANKPWLQYFDSETRTVRPPGGVEYLQPLMQLWWDIFCSTVHPALSPDMLGLAGALAQLTLGAPRSPEQAAFEEHMRKQAWEQGTMDYMGRDSFDNIWRKISETLSQAPRKEETQKPAEVPPTKSASEPKLPESKVPEPKSRKSPPAGSEEAPGLTSSTLEPTPIHQSSKGIETPGKTEPILEPAAPTSVPKTTSDEEKSVPIVPHTPSIIEATPPTSPPIVTPTAPIADIQALKVDAPPPETPPVISVTSKLVSTVESTTPQSVKPDTSVDTVTQDVKSEPSEVEKPVVIEQQKSAETIEAPAQDTSIIKEVIPVQEQIPVGIPISLGEKTADLSTPELAPSTQMPSLTTSEAEKVVDSIVPEVTPPTQMSAPVPSGDEKVVGSTAPEVPPSTQVSTVTSSGDEKVLDSTVPEVASSPEVLMAIKGDEKIASSTIPEVLSSPQVSASKITSESLTGENVVGSTVSEVPPPTKVSTIPSEKVASSPVPEVPVPPPAQVSAIPSEKVASSPVPEVPVSPPAQVSTIPSEKVASSPVPEVPVSPPAQVSTIPSEKVASSPVPEVPVSPPTQASTHKEIAAPAVDEKTVVLSDSEVSIQSTQPAPVEIPSTETDKVIIPVASEIPPLTEKSGTAKSVVSVTEVQPLEVSKPKEISPPEAKKETSSAPIVAEVSQPVQASAPPPPPPSSDNAAPSLAEPPSSPQPSAPKEEGKHAVPAAVKPTSPTAPQPPQVPVSPAEKEVSVPQVAKPGLPISPTSISAETSKTPSGEKLDSKESKASEKQISEESKSMPVPTSPSKTKDVANRAGEKKLCGHQRT